jgi:hypothetical protein
MRMRTLGSRVGVADTRTVRPFVLVKQVDPHYSTPEHRRWREAVTARAAGRCEKCGRSDGRLFADHIVELADGGAPFALSNGQALCGSCHSTKTATERQGRAGAAQTASRHPVWLKPSRVPLTIVCGPPASGKSSYVAARATAADLVVDLDLIASRLAGTTMHAWGREWIDSAIRERNRLLGKLSWDRVPWPAAWLILTEPRAERRDWWHRTIGPASIVVLETPEGVCWQRIADDPERQPFRSEQSQAVARWWVEYEPRSGDQRVVYAGRPGAP